MPYLAESLTDTSEMILRVVTDLEGGLLTRMRQAQSGPRSAQFTPRGTDTPDPTFDGIDQDDARVDLERLEQLTEIVHNVAAEVYDIAARYTRNALDGGSRGWCTSCSRFGIRTPITLRASGVPYFAAYCRFCGTYRGRRGVLPPLDAVRRHQENLSRQKAS